jgi:hypothetical protein
VLLCACCITLQEDNGLKNLGVMRLPLPSIFKELCLIQLTKLMCCSYYYQPCSPSSSKRDECLCCSCYPQPCHFKAFSKVGNQNEIVTNLIERKKYIIRGIACLRTVLINAKHHKPFVG